MPAERVLNVTVFEPTRKELQLLEPIISKVSKGMGQKLIPNICYTTYKNRWYSTKKIKIWGYQDLGTNEYKDLFCTNEYYEYINIPKTISEHSKRYKDLGGCSPKSTKYNSLLPPNSWRSRRRKSREDFERENSSSYCFGRKFNSKS